MTAITDVELEEIVSDPFSTDQEAILSKELLDLKCRNRKLAADVDEVETALQEAGQFLLRGDERSHAERIRDLYLDYLELHHSHVDLYTYKVLAEGRLNTAKALLTRAAAALRSSDLLLQDSNIMSIDGLQGLLSEIEAASAAPEGS